jgi:hypothetical protein
MLLCLLHGMVVKAVCIATAASVGIRSTELPLPAVCLLLMRRGMAALAEEVQQLQELNISWCAGVEDYGLGRLCSLTGLTALNLAATGLEFTDAAVLQALSQLGRLARLRLDRWA